MRKGNLIKMAAPAILSAAMMVSGLPVMAADFTEDTAVEASVDEFDAADDTADAFASDEETPFVDDQTAAEDEFAATAEDGYKYVYAGLTWPEYWASEGIYAADNTSSSDEVDRKVSDTVVEHDKGGFDAVTRATANHGPHRGSFQCMATLYDVNGGTYEISHWNSKNEAVLTDGSVIQLNLPENMAITKADGTVTELDHYVITGMKYIPVAVKAEDYDAFKAKYTVVEDGSAVVGGFTEKAVIAYNKTANVTANTNGLKEAVKNADGTFSFTARKTGTDSGLKDEAQKTATNVTPTVREHAAATDFGAFLRVDITGDGYGDLGSNMYAVRWDYYGNGDTILRSFGTKFAADNWMHSSLGIQLGLTDSYRCQLPDGTDGTGKWQVTVYAMGYADYSFPITVTEENIKDTAAEVNTDALKALVEKASALKEADYTADSWATFKGELAEAQDALAAAASQSSVDAAASDLEKAMNDLVKVDKVTITLNKKTATIYKGKTTTLKATVKGADAAKVTFTSNNTKVATVNKTTGKVTAKAKGTATITAKYGDVKVTCKVTVKNPTLTLSKTSASVKVGKTTKITAKATPTGKVTYKSSNKKVATVSSNGTIKGIKKGTAKITVTCNGVSKTVKVTVK